MIRLAGVDFVRAVDLLEQDYAHKLVRERHFGEAKFEVGSVQNRIIQSDGSANDQLDMTDAVQSPVFDLRCKFLAGELLAVDGQGDEERVVAQMFGDALAFLGFDLPLYALGRVLRRLFVCDFDDVEFAITRKSLGIFVDGVAKIPFLHTPGRNNVDLHSRFSGNVRCQVATVRFVRDYLPSSQQTYAEGPSAYVC